MSADGEIEVAVRAEGTDDAAAQLAEADADGAGGALPTGGRGGEGGLRTAIAGGIVGGLVSQLLGPLLDILDPILKLFQAFVAPVGALLLRLLQPVLRFFVRLLPQWIAWLSSAEEWLSGVVSWLGRLWSGFRDWITALPGRIWSAIKQGWDTLKATVQNVINRVNQLKQSVVSTLVGFWNGLKSRVQSLIRFVKNLPQRIGSAIANRLPGVPSGGDVSNTAGNLAQGAEQRVENTFGVNIEGGLGAFVERIERNNDIDLRPGR